MNGHSGAMSPVSVDGSDWSGINQYQKTEPPFSPTFSNRSNLATPPTSGVPSGSNGAVANGESSGRLSDSGNPSPPSSVAGARSSDGTLADKRGRRHRQLEEILGQHYVVLRRFLHTPYWDERANQKSSKARDKLLRLSPTQFHELSTDVYDELLRRQQAAPSPSRPPRPDVPPFLQPRKEFHEKRNHARQRLAALQHGRFRDLSTDVYCELERRFPQFPERESRRASPAPSFRGRPSNGYPPSGYGGYPPPPASRSQSRGPPSRMGGRGYPSGGPPGSPMGAFPPRKGSLAGPPSMNGDAPTAKPFHSNMIVPNKSTMVEDDDDMAGSEVDDDARSDAFALDAVLSRRDTTTTMGDGERRMLAESQSQVSTLQDKVNQLEEMIKMKDEELLKYHDDQDKVEKLEDMMKSKEEELLRLQEQDRTQTNGAEPHEWESVKLELENKVLKAEDLNGSLQTELDKVRAEHDAMQSDFQKRIYEASQQNGGDAELQARFADLEIQHKGLQAELQGQQKVTEEVRHEAAGFLMEMRALSEQSHSRWEHEERLSSEVLRLEEEVKQWKARYTKAKTQLRHLRASSAGLSELRPDINTVSKDNEFLREDGVIMDVHVTKFQIAIDELLRVSRFDEHHFVMQQIKAVVVAVRHILHDVEVAPSSGDSQRTKATRKVSATANNLITACRNFTSSSGLSPVSLLDAAASHMSTAVIELIRVVRIQPSPIDGFHEEEEEHFADLKSPDYFSVAPSQSRSRRESVYSALSPPSNHSRHPTEDHSGLSEQGPNGLGMNINYAAQAEEHELQELKLYVEDQTDGLVQSIQALVASIRSEEGLTTVRTHVSAISSVVTNVSSSTTHYIHKPEADPALRERAQLVIENLEYHRGRLADTAAEGEGASSADHLREFTNKLPPIAFEIARETKELVQRLEPVDDDGSEDDFR